MSKARPLRQVPPGRDPGTRPPMLPPGQISLNEVYYTVQGECAWVGTPTVFVRTSHCPLRCVWCDSKYTFFEGRPWTTDDVVARVRTFPARHACVTGGEPLAQAETVRLVERLTREGYTVEVETSGSEDIAPLNALPDDLRGRVTVNLDVKLPGSAMANFNRWDNLSKLRPHDQLKFIVADRDDFQAARDVLRRHGVPCPVWAHPVWGQLEAKDLAEWVKEAGPPWRLGVQLHKFVWGDVRGV